VIKRKSKPERIMLRIVKGGLQPADTYAASRLREKHYHVDDVVAADLKKLNNPKFDRLIHRIGQLCAKNIEAFEGMQAHAVLKRLQWESNTHCESMGVMVPNVGLTEVRWPLSLSFEDVDDGLRHEIALAFCRHISKVYWPDLSPESVEEMAESFVEET
jgi:hypothetical protein